MTERRSRSASPTREAPQSKKQKTGGFKWKEKKPKDAGETGSSGVLERGYRNRSPKRDSYREREQGDATQRDRSPRRDRYEDKFGGREGKREPERSREASDAQPPPPPKDASKDADKSKKPKKEKKSKPPPITEPMIIVNINDRLGTKAAIPCLASDSIKAFKAVVAAHIGRQPHEIMLKRQGERPFKDQLTLQDYGVSNGVQLDLELDTGD